MLFFSVSFSFRSSSTRNFMFGAFDCFDFYILCTLCIVLCAGLVNIRYLCIIITVLGLMKYFIYKWHKVFVLPAHWQCLNSMENH